MTKELLQQCQAEFEDYADLLGQFQAPSDSCIGGSMIRANSMADKLKQALAQQEPNPWADAVIDQLVVHHIYQSVHDTEPRKAIYDLLCMNQSIALDPQVSSDAQALIDRGRKEAQQEQPASVDAYVGAREDAAIWKKRALEAEELNRKFIAEVNGPTYLGEPVKQDQPAQEPCGYLDEFGNFENMLLAWTRMKEEPGVAWAPVYKRPAPTQPALSDLEIRNLIEKAFTDFAAMKQIPREALETDIAYVPSLGLFLCRAIEAHCRGGANHG